ncbi:MAG: catalase, partial [Thioalkalivibrio sp.]|nr:catalase [Thioalkalivibrio sp.]
MSDKKPKSKKSPSAKSSAKKTASAPSNAKPAPGRNALEKQSAATEELVDAISAVSHKTSDFGRDNAVSPPKGEAVKPSSPLVGASTVTEEGGSEKTGDGAAEGQDPLTTSLDRARVDNGGKVLTTNQGVPVGDNQNSLKAGLRGPTLLEDFILREKITHFDHERIPERIVHARGSGAHGYFECYEPFTEYTRAAPFQDAGKRTPVFVRFSTVAGERGSVDTARDVRGFSVKFYTD